MSDYARFMISVMNNEHVTGEIARQRVTILQNQITPDEQTVFCEDSPDPSHCTVSTGFGLSWHVVRIGNEVILDHTGKDPDVVTLALLCTLGRIPSESFFDSEKARFGFPAMCPSRPAGRINTPG